MLTSLELCAGAGGQALGLEKAGFHHEALVEIDNHCCNTLRANRPSWNVIEDDLRVFKERAGDFAGVDVVAGGLPCPPFSVAGKQLGALDERNLFPDALDIIDAIRPKAVMIENVRGFLDAVFEDYRLHLKRQLKKLGYEVDWRLLNASDFGVSQLRPRVVIVATRKDFWPNFAWQINGVTAPAILRQRSLVDRKSMVAQTWGRRVQRRPGHRLASTAIR
jgi:DNA (cytosine-5)-methyltransferase 1